MSPLFDRTEINGMALANRFVRSATWEGMAAEDGAVTPVLIRTMERLAQGGVGLIITGHAYVEKQGQAGPWQLGIHEDRLVEGLGRMTDAVHRKGGKIVAQVAHSGIFADPVLTGHPPAAPTAVAGVSKHEVLPMTLSDVARVVEAFGRAADRARTAGFDGVQLHSAHGYLLSQFLSPFFNRRRDLYGGDLDNRVRIHLEILRAIRERVGNAFPVLAKVNTGDFLDGGLDTDEAVAAGVLMQQNGLDAIELSGGTGLSGKNNPVRTGIRDPEQEAYFQSAAARYKSRLAIPVILVGGIRSFEKAEMLVTQGTCDYISMSRPFIREPDLVRRWRSGDRTTSACLSDSRCFVPAMSGKGVYCVMDENGRRQPKTPAP